VIAEQFGKLTLTPIRENGALSYAARGKVDFFGEQAMIRVGGAGARFVHNSRLIIPAISFEFEVAA
jgi:hypothetical protein